MQSLKCWVAVGVAACVFSVRAGDSEAQTKARQALEQKLNELNGQPNAAAPTAPAESVQPSPKTVPAPTRARPADSQSISKAREALEQKLKESEPPPPAPANPPSAEPPAKPKKPRTRKEKPAPATVAAPATPTPPTAAPTVPPSPGDAAAAADDAAISKAREALREKMNTLTPPAEVAAPAPTPKVVVQPPPSEPPPVATPAPVPAPAAAPPPVASTPPPPPPPVPDVPATGADPDAIAKAREAMRQKMNELSPQPTAPATPAPAAASAPVVPALPAPSAAAAPVQPPSTPELTAPPEADPAAIAKAREAVRMRMQTMPLETSSVSGMATASARGSMRPPLSFPPLASPPLPISDAKEQRLQQLLEQYRSDLISPEQYHAARAKILAEP